ncbi:MAG: hypothetical protein U0836_21760 [Pirellulales bacterium]
MTTDQVLLEPADPRPGALLVTLSTLVIGMCLFMSSFLAAALFNPWDLCAVAAAVFLGPLPIALMGLQYSGVFRKKIVASQLAAAILGVFGLIGMLAVSGFALDVATNFGQGDMDTVSFCKAAAFGTLFLLLPCLICLATAWQDLRWSRELTARGEAQQLAHFPRPWIAPIIAGVSVLAMGWVISFLAPPYAEHVGPENAPRTLPATASDVSYCTTSRGSERIEFTIDEPAFRQWVDDVVVQIRSIEKGDVFPLAEIKEHIAITRYNGVLGRSPEPNSPTSVDVREGLVYRWTYTDHNVMAVYDRPTRRAYLSVDWY